MQKRASRSKKYYETLFTPLPIDPEAELYFDRVPVPLPYAEDFPNLHYHDRYEIGVCEDGDGLFFSEGAFESVSKGDVIFIPPGCRHYSRSLYEQTPCQCRFLYLRAEAVNAVLSIVGEQDGQKLVEAARRIPPVIRQREYPAMAAPLSEMMDTCMSQAPYREELMILRLAVFLLESHRSLPVVNHRTEQPLLICYDDHSAADRIAEYLSLHYSESQTAQELSKICHLSESQLRRNFCKAYGMPPIAYRHFLRCNIASGLLSRTSLPIAEITERVGYASTSDFYRQFHKRFGMSPSEYRRQNC